MFCDDSFISFVKQAENFLFWGLNNVYAFIPLKPYPFDLSSTRSKQHVY